MAGLVGDTATAIRVIAEAVPPALVLTQHSNKVAMLATTVVVPTATPGPAWSQNLGAGFFRIDGWIAALRSSSLVYSQGQFYNRAVYPYPTAGGSSANPIPMTGSAMVVPYALSAGAGMDVPAATYVVDFLVWGLAA
jgi:hypothetical protein